MSMKEVDFKSKEEVKECHVKDKALRNELKATKSELEAATKELRRLRVECQKLQKCLSEKVAVREVTKPAKEQARREREALCNSIRSQKSSPHVCENRNHKGLHLSEAEMNWRAKIGTLEREAVRLRQELQESYHSNQELTKQVNNYGRNISATLQKPSASRLHNHSSTLVQSRCKQSINGGKLGSSEVSSSNPTTSSEDLGSSGQSKSSPVDGKNLLFKYECSLVPILVPTSDDTCSGDAKDSILQRSNYSSPDLGIESDPYYVSSYSSSTSSSESCPPPPNTDCPQQQKLRVCSGKGHRRTDASSQTTETFKTYSTDLEKRSTGKVVLSEIHAVSPDSVVRGLCSFEDPEYLHQELKQSLITLQQMRSTLFSRLDGNKYMEYGVLHKVESCCERLLKKLNGCRNITDSFQSSPLTAATLGPKSSQSCSSSLPSNEKLLSDSSQLSVPSSVDTVRHNAAFKKGNEEASETHVLNLQKKLKDLEELYRRAVEENTANKTKNLLMNRVLEKQLSATANVLKKAKTNLKQNESLVFKQFEAITNKC